MAFRIVDTATVYQIFYKSHKGLKKAQIARELGLSCNCVSWHLSGRYLHQYPEATLRRIRALSKPVLKQKTVDPPWMRLSDASYFFPSRPRYRTLMEYGPYRKLQTAIINGVRATTKEAVLEFVHDKIPDMPCGLLLSQSACHVLRLPCRHLYVHSWDLEVPELPPSLIHFAIRIQEWTGLPFVSLAASDLVN